MSLALLALGWTVGYAQRSEPQFTLLIDAPAGETTIECASGCALIDRGIWETKTPGG